MAAIARLVLRDDPSKAAPLNPSTQLTIGRAANNGLCLKSFEGVAPHHAVVRHSPNHGWLVCDWGSHQGTYLEGQRISQCRALADTDEIQLGADGPVLVFQTVWHSQTPVNQAPQVPAPPAARPHAAVTAPAAARASRTAAAAPAAQPKELDFAGRTIPFTQIRSVFVRSQPVHPHSFSWWLLICLGGLLLLPFPWVFWPLQVGALLGWILLGSRKRHLLVVTLRDGIAYRHTFANKVTALGHRNGIRKSIAP